MNFDETRFKQAAADHLARCRPGDWAHAQRVAEWVKKLDPPREFLQLSLAAAYIHDIGWRDVFPKSELITINQLRKNESLANSNSEPFTRDFLKQFPFTDQETETILRYVRAADAHRADAEDEAFIVDADSLSKLCLDHVKEKYARSEWLRVWARWNEEIPKRLRTKQGKRLLQPLLEQLKQDIERAEDARLRSFEGGDGV